MEKLVYTRSFLPDLPAKNSFEEKYFNCSKRSGSKVLEDKIAGKKGKR